jgi:hypothetical protein
MQQSIGNREYKVPENFQFYRHMPVRVFGFVFSRIFNFNICEASQRNGGFPCCGNIQNTTAVLEP